MIIIQVITLKLIHLCTSLPDHRAQRKGICQKLFGGYFFVVTASVTWWGASGRLLGDGRAVRSCEPEWQGIDEGRAIISRTEPAWMNVSL